MADTIQKYGAQWPKHADALQIEQAAIKRGGLWKNTQGKQCGLGLFYHYKAAQTLMWPEDDHHRWSDLMLSEILTNKHTVIIGPKDSGKSYTALAKFGLTDYFMFPDETLVLISSTDLRGLELRVWGALKDLWRRAVNRWDWLAGKPLDSKHAICTDDIADEFDVIRDMRKGIICFISGSLVDTPSGPKKIESLRVGDKVFNAMGVGTIKETFTRTASVLVRVTLSDGRTIDCTPEHPFFTARGWIKAACLLIGEKVFSADETLSLLQQRHCKDEIPQQAWVVSVKVLERSGDPRWDQSKGGYPVHNIEVSGHPSYSVNGVVVHNCIPCRSTSGAWLGINNYVGLKQKRRRLLSDEVQFMSEQFLDAPASLDGINFKGVYVGHPLGQGDPLDKLAEPKGGWGSEGEITKTTVWENKFLSGHTVNLVGPDSPNFDFPQTDGPKFPYLVSQQMIDGVVSFYGKDSTQYWSKMMGVRRSGLYARRCITIKLCEQSRAFEKVIWAAKPRTRIYGLDPAYGGIGGDRCVGGYVEFGETTEGIIVLTIQPPTIVPVSVRYDQLPEDQIATYVMGDCVRANIPPENVFYDSTGRGALGTSFARIWSAMVNPVEFGGKATDRPVSLDHFTKDAQTGQRRLKLCHEEYSKFVTELWFSVRYAIEAGQVRELPREVADEGCQREWIDVAGGRIEIEPKSDMKERTGRSPDLFDWLCVCVEGARRKGFNISKLANPETEETSQQWLNDLAGQAAQRHRAHSLDYAA